MNGYFNKMLTVDRIEEGIAVCIDENGNITNIPLSILPEGVRESDTLLCEDGRYIRKKADKKEIQKRFDKMFKK